MSLGLQQVDTLCSERYGEGVPLLNYRTEVPIQRTLNQVHDILVKGKARAVATEYDADGKPTALAFEVNTPFGYRNFVLPVNAGAVHQVLNRQRVDRRYQTMDHAHRVAWRILKDWIEAQLAIVATEMVTLDQVMLPYLRTENGATLYERYRDRQLTLEAAQ